MYGVGDRDRHPRVTREAHAITHIASFQSPGAFFHKSSLPFPCLDGGVDSCVLKDSYQVGSFYF